MMKPMKFRNSDHSACHYEPFVWEFLHLSKAHKDSHAGPRETKHRCQADNEQVDVDRSQHCQYHNETQAHLHKT
jgi:creatinine amidohydrolase/Fe(II)-dependent formamide hydrolase-like protein